VAAAGKRQLASALRTATDSVETQGNPMGDCACTPCRLDRPQLLGHSGLGDLQTDMHRSMHGDLKSGAGHVMYCS
jgi:hypothetical protein